MRRQTLMMLLATCLSAELFSGPVLARGNHYGWCRGVGNPHQSAQGCGQSGSQHHNTQTSGPSSPTATQLPPKGTPSTPQSVAVPVLAPTAVPARIPQRVPPVIATPTATPQAIPQATPTPLQTPIKTPVPTPVAVPNQIPQAIPQPVTITAKPSANHLAVPGHKSPTGYAVIVRPKPRQAKLTAPSGQTAASATHRPKIQSAPKKFQHIAAVPGRHAPHDPPLFKEGAAGEEWECVASGFGPRRTANARGQLLASGALRHIGNVDAMARDVPARHLKYSGCIISIKRRK
ncbi:hypothetical protein J7400_17535 [Shimia sp. R9_2]|uniref:hypothetical protein n=1 Tax=Shimia sp. R9_2 TaxID=2821112 RepID=UPI001ADCF705|nr:hypothetical protein [Shimia sp. R9_2]MBO9398478.1 hypothetical protein [Shimia sp. R9_2]